MRSLVLAPLLTTALSFTALAQPAVLRGVVIADSTRAPIPGAEVAIPALRLTATSDSAGAYVLTGNFAGSHELVVRKLGYMPVAITVVVDAGGSATQNVTLAARAVLLDSVIVREPPVVSARMREFEERRLLGFGHFVTRAQLARSETRRTSEVLSAVPGLAVVRGMSGMAWVAMNRGYGSTRTPGPIDRARGARPRCYSDVYLDGVLIYGGRRDEPLFDVSQITVSTIEAIEFYAGVAQVPTRFNRPGSACGVLVIWSREGG